MRHGPGTRRGGGLGDTQPLGSGGLGVAGQVPPFPPSLHPRAALRYLRPRRGGGAIWDADTRRFLWQELPVEGTRRAPARGSFPGSLSRGQWGFIAEEASPAPAGRVWGAVLPPVRSVPATTGVTGPGGTLPVPAMGALVPGRGARGCSTPGREPRAPALCAGRDFGDAHAPAPSRELLPGGGAAPHPEPGQGDNEPVVPLPDAEGPSCV